MKLISIVIPAFNEQENLPTLYGELSKIFKQLAQVYNYELIIIDDGSRDNTWMVIKKLAQQDSHIHGIKFSRNFGHQIALTAGYDAARGDAVISMDADLQDSPQVILDMIKRWEQGADIVYARRSDRSDGFLKKLTATWYYCLLNAVSDVNMPRNVGDFRLINKKVLKHLNSCRERSRYMRGLVAWLGFKHDFVDFVRPNRTAGTTAYTWKKMFKFALDGLTGFSFFPLKMAGYIGVVAMGIGGFLSVRNVWMLLDGSTTSTMHWLLAVIYLLFGFLFCAVWTLGEYIGRIYEHIKARPLYIVDETVNEYSDN